MDDTFGPFDFAPKIIAKDKTSRRSAQGDRFKGHVSWGTLCQGRSFASAQDFAWRLGRRQNSSRCTISQLIFAVKCPTLYHRLRAGKQYWSLTKSNWHLAIGNQPKSKTLNHKGHPFDSPFASSGSLRAGCETQKETLNPAPN
jgi:hypothetical protein